MTRSQAFEAFIAAVNKAVPEVGKDWPARRAIVREAGVEFAHAAAKEVINEVINARV